MLVNSRDRGCALLLLGLFAVGCSQSQAASRIRSSTDSDSIAQSQSSDSARASFVLHRIGASSRIPVSSAKLWFDDGSGERLIPGEIMGLDVTWQDNLPNGGYYPTATTGQMRIRAVLSGDAQGRDTLAVASMTVPLSRDTQWSIAMIVRPSATVATRCNGA